jgi:hypothetical protein
MYRKEIFVTLAVDHSYQAFTRLAIIIDSVWVIQTLSWLQFSALVGLRIIADIALPFLILWAALKVALVISSLFNVDDLFLYM